MTEKTINLGCMKIHTKSDTKHYAPWDVINPQLFNPIPADAKTYKLSPSTTLFFKKVRCAEFNFGWRQIKIKPKKPKEKNMYKSKPFSEREYAAVDRTLITNNYDAQKTITSEQRLSRLRENRASRKSMSFWQKTAVFLVEAHYDISRFFDDHKEYNYWNKWQYNEGTPKDKLTAFFIKQNKKLSSKSHRFMGNMDEMEAMEIAEEKSIRQGIQHIFKPRRTRTLVPQQERLPVIIENVIPNETIVPNAPALPEPERNPEHKEGTTINNYNFNITCGIL